MCCSKTGKSMEIVIHGIRTESRRRPTFPNCERNPRSPTTFGKLIVAPVEGRSTGGDNCNLRGKAYQRKRRKPGTRKCEWLQACNFHPSPFLKEQIREGQRTQPYDWQRSNVIRHARVCISSGKYFPFPAPFAGTGEWKTSMERPSATRFTADCALMIFFRISVPG